MAARRRTWKIAASMIAATMAAAGLGMITSPTASAEKRLLWEDLSFADRGLWTDVLNGHPKSQATMRPENTFVRGGDLVLVTQRHCATKGAALTAENAQVKPCTSKGLTQYSIGRVHRAGLWPTDPTNFRIKIRATLPRKAIKGTRSALWMKNYGPNTNYCTGVPRSERPTDLGELDILEWYGKRKSVSTATTHVSCKSKDDTSTWQDHNRRSGLTAGAHNWTVEKRGRTVTYKVGGKLVGKDTCGEGKLAISKAQCDRILNQGWELRLQGEVFKKKYGGPSWTKNFPVQELVIHSVQVWALT